MHDPIQPHLIWDDLSWCLRRIPESWRKLMQERPNQLFIAGGFIRSVIANEKVNDVDFFCGSKDAAAACALATSQGGKNRVISTDNAFTVLTRPFTAQFIHRWTFTNPLDCIASFDFTIAKAAIWWDGDNWASSVSPRFYPDLAAKRLVYTSPIRNEEAGGSLLRVLKFYQRGYRIPLDSMGACIARLCKAVEFHKLHGRPGTEEWEAGLAKILTGLLREVDPNVDPTHEAHLPSSGQTHPVIAAMVESAARKDADALGQPKSEVPFPTTYREGVHMTSEEAIAALQANSQALTNAEEAHNVDA